MAVIEFNKNPSRWELLVFAELLAGFFLLAGYLLHKGGYAGTAFMLWGAAPAVAVIGGAVGYRFPKALRPVYLAWMYAAYPIGWTVSHVILGIVYYLMLTPIGFVMRRCGRDAMHRTFYRGADTYWVPHDPGGEPSRYFRQF